MDVNLEWPQDWRHLGDCLRAARDGRPLAQIAKASGVAARTIQQYEEGKARRRPTDKMWRLMNFYRWTPDSARRVLGGGYPATIPPFTQAQAARFEQGVLDSPDLTDREKLEFLRKFLIGDSSPT